MASKRTKQPQSSQTSATEPPVAGKTDIRGDLVFLAVITLVFLLLAAAYNRLIPFRSDSGAKADIAAYRLATNPDEAAHVANAEVYRSGRIPTFRPGNPDFEAHQPPLYYVLIAPTLSDSSTTSQPAALARWISILIGAATIWAVYACIACSFPGRSYLARSTAAFVALLPMNISLCASITNDVLTNLVIVLALWQIARIVNLSDEAGEAREVRESVLLGLIMAAGIYTKTSTLVVCGVSVLAALLLARLKLMSSRNALVFATIPIVVAAVLASPWLIRNTRLYGDPVAQHIFMSAFQQTTMTTQHMLSNVSVGNYAWLEAKITFESFWGVFDSMMLFLPQPLYGALAVVGIITVFGSLRWYKAAELSLRARVMYRAFIALTAATVLVFARFNMTFFQPQGRYLYPALVPVALFLVTGIVGIAGKESPALTAKLPTYLAGALVLLNAFCLYTISSIF